MHVVSWFEDISLDEQLDDKFHDWQVEDLNLGSFVSNSMQITTRHSVC